MTHDSDSWLDELHHAEYGRPLDVWGEYEVLEEIGRGGQGTVYRGRDRRSGQAVALKRLHASDAGARSRLHEEVQAVRSLGHEAIVEVLEVLSWNGRDVIVMDWIDGRPPHDWASGRTVREIVEVGLAMALGLLHAHQQGVLHRDIKPSNILIDNRGRPHILDFGLARRSDRSARVTTTGDFLGTLAFAAPEQILAPAERVDVRSDLYSLAVLIYWMLAGVPPYAIDVPLPRLLHAILEDAPTPVRRHRAEVDGSLEAVLAKALEKEPSERYRSVDAFAADLERWIRGEPVLARPQNGWGAARRWVRRHKLVSSLATIAALLLVSTIVVIGVYGAHATRDAERISRLQSFLGTTVEGSWNVTARDDGGALDVLESASERAGRELAGEPAVELKVRNRLAGQYAELEQWESSAREARRALDLCDVTKEADPVDRTIALHRLGFARVMSGDEAGLAQIEEAIRHHESLSESPTADLVFLNARLGLALRTGIVPPDLDRAETYYQRALELLSRPDSNAEANAPGLLHGYGDLLRARGDQKGAVARYEGALAAYRAQATPGRFAYARCAESAGDAYMQLGDMDASERCFRLAIGIREGRLDDRLPVCIANVGTTLLFRDRPAEALDHYHEAIAVRLERLAELHPTERSRLVAIATRIREHGLDSETAPVVRAAFQDTDPSILPLFDINRGRIATCLERLGATKKAASLRG